MHILDTPVPKEKLKLIKLICDVKKKKKSQVELQRYIAVKEDQVELQRYTAEKEYQSQFLASSLYPN